MVLNTPTRFFAIFLLLAITHSGLFSQETMSFGKIDMADLKMTNCPIDSTASAMILGDIGSTHFEYLNTMGFYMVYERHIRIKIFRKEGYSLADMSIPIYRFNDTKETMMEFKAKTYNLENGKIVESKLKDESIFYEEVDSYQRNTKFTFPNVKEGSVLEVRIKIHSQFFDRLRNWTFQREVPVRWSQYEVSIPEYFHYAIQTYGYLNFFVNKRFDNPNSIMSAYGSYNTINYTDHGLRLAVKDAPAIVEEPFMTTIQNYTSRAEYVLHSYQFPDRPYRELNASWQQIGDDLMKDEDFGKNLNKGKIVKDLANLITSETTDTLERLIKVHTAIRKHMKWNEYYSKYPTDLQKAFKDRIGNSADINLLLYLLLKDCGFTVYPVILSTRGHGLALESRPDLGAMNDVVCLVKLGAKEYLLDATNPARPWNMLPFQCLNGNGLALEPDRVRWINLANNEKNSYLAFAEFKISSEGDMEGTITTSLSGYAAADSRNEYHKKGKEAYVEKLSKGFKNWETEVVGFENLDNILETFKTTYKVESSEISQVNNNLIFFSALCSLGQNTNPFIQEKRYSPVDFGCPQKDSYVFTFELPEGYTVESLPENIRLELPNQSGFYKFNISFAEGKIALNSQMSINKTIFTPEEYEILRNFFIRVIDKQNQKIVLKKI